jgi:phosphotransferase family enzyme
MAHDRTVLGPADVSDSELTQMVARLLRASADDVTLVDSHATEVAYDLPALTTAGRYWVRGHAAVRGAQVPFAFFVKHVQSFARSPLFAEVPPDVVAMAEAGVPWRTEPLVYRSDLCDRLPPGLRMPRSLGVFDLDEKSAAVWLEEVETHHARWDLPRFERAAYLLGRFAASPQVRERALVGQHPFTVRDYLEGRLTHQVLPLLADEKIWHHPLVAGAFGGDLRDLLVDMALHADDLVDELAALPRLTAHGDACPNNLLVVEDSGADGFTVIDFGFMTLLPVGFDLGQLLVGDVQVGRLPAASLAEVEGVIVPAYVEGLRAEGCDIPESVVRRAHALHLMVFVGLSTLPFEHLDAPVTPELEHVTAERAAIARFSLDLLAQTSQVSSSPG